MRQTYYAVSDESFAGLQNDLQQYTALAKQLLTPGLNTGKKAAVLQQRNDLKADIQTKLTESGTLLGFLNDDEVEAFEAANQGMANIEAKSFLRTNGIPEQELEGVLAALMELDSGGASANVSFFLERAKQQRQNVIVWIE